MFLALFQGTGGRQSCRHYGASNVNSTTTVYSLNRSFKRPFQTVASFAQAIVIAPTDAPRRKQAGAVVDVQLARRLKTPVGYLGLGSKHMQGRIFDSVLGSRTTPHKVFYFMSGVGIGIVAALGVISRIGL